jgi:hypothetical protein
MPGCEVLSSPWSAVSFSPSLYDAHELIFAVNRALQNPGLFTSEHYRQAALAVAAGVAIRLVVTFPVRRFARPKGTTLTKNRSLALGCYYGSSHSS